MTDICTINPATGAVIKQYPVMSQQEVAGILSQVHSVQQSYAQSPISERVVCMQNTAQLLRKNKEQYAALITEEMGKPILQSLAEIEKCAVLFDYYAECGPTFLQPELVKTELSKSYCVPMPLGIIYAIMPWNFPFWQVMRFAAPNLMLGNAGVLKHAPISTGVSLAIEKLLVAAGFPENLFRSLVMEVSLSPYVIQHPYVAGVTLTGSNATGKIVAKEAGAALKKVVLELGGSDPYVVLADADLELAAAECVASRLGNAGQVCIAAKRAIVVESVRAEFEAQVIAKAKQYSLGNPVDKNTLLGPMARLDLRDKVHAQVQRAITDGAKCVLGGEIPNQPGFYYPATVLVDVAATSPAFHEEIFGPVIGITAAKDEADALRLANDTPYGLSAAIFTRDVKKGEQMAEQVLVAGTCAVNMRVASDPRLPFGGIKQSGFGRELSREGMREFANIKTILIK